MEFDGEIWRDDRSTPKTTDLWIKTTNNATNPEIQIRAIFWEKILGKFLGEIGGIGGSKPWQPLLRYHMMRAKPEGVPNLHGLTRVSVIAEGDSRGSG